MGWLFRHKSFCSKDCFKEGVLVDFLRYWAVHAIDFTVASIPLIIVYLQLKIFKLGIKKIAVCLSLMLVGSIYLWVNVRNLNLILYQIVPYISCYIWLGAENYLIRKK